VSENIDRHRRRFFNETATTIAAISVGLIRSGATSAGESGPPALSASPPQPRAGFGPLKQVDAGVLRIGYAELGPVDGQAVVLLHGWPYDIHSFVEVAPLLAWKGYRVIVPYLRGYGSTRFLYSDTFRNGQQSALALDVLALMNALKIGKAIIGGFDWGARTAEILAALWPERCRAIVAVSGYLIASRTANRQPLSPEAEYRWWYQYYFATERGRRGYETNRHAFNKLIWKNASPKWAFDDATYDRTAAAFDNPDHVSIVIHNYRWRLSLEAGERQYDSLEQRLAEGPSISVPAITIGSDFDGAAADGGGPLKKFSGPHLHRVFAGIGHNVPQEAPDWFAKAVIEADRCRV